MIDLHAEWRNGQEGTRALEVANGLFVNVLLPAYYWATLDWIGEQGWDVPALLRAAWQETLLYDGKFKHLGDYEVFRRCLVESIFIYEDGARGVNEGRANDNREDLTHEWGCCRQRQPADAR